MDGLVDVRREGTVCVLTLTRPEKLNALSSALEDALGGALGGPEVGGCQRGRHRGLGRAFSAGADVAEFSDGSGSDPRLLPGGGHVYERVGGAAAADGRGVHGYCLGGGLELALACDFRVAEVSAVFGLPEVALGIVPSAGGLTRLVRLVGAARAKELMLLRERFSAAEALSFGVVTEVVEDGDALPRAVELAERLAGLPPLQCPSTKQAAEVAGEASREAALLIERLAYGSWRRHRRLTRQPPRSSRNAPRDRPRSGRQRRTALG